jgi:glycine/D-amino acid oxidase-like deaminating enzyme
VVTSDYLRDARVVVVGAGAIGSALGYRLAQAGALVTTVERRFPGAGTTGATFAYLNGVDKPPRAYHRLSVLGIRDQEDLADEVGGDWVHVTGGLHWAEAADAARAVGLQRTMRQMLEWGARVDRLTPAQATAELEPDLRIDPDVVADVWLVDRAGWLDPVAMAHGTMRAAIRRYGARLVHAEVVGLRRADEVIEAVVLDDGTELGADIVVDAAGPDAARVAALAGVTLPVQRTPGVLIVTGPAPVALAHVVYAGEVHLRPDGGARLMVQWDALDTDVLDGSSLPVDAPRIGEAMARARAVVPGLAEVEPEAIRTGVRPVPSDGYPLVGFDATVVNLYHVVTHSGITLAARLAALVTEELTGGDTAPLDAYRPGRFAGAGRGGAAAGVAPIGGE